MIRKSRRWLLRLHFEISHASQGFDVSQQPLQMPITAPGLELRLHVSAEECFCPHKATFIMLDPHRTLWIIQTVESILIKDCFILQIRKLYNDGFRRLRLESKLTALSHVLDG